ncbi:MAG: hypothetical protein ACX931_07135 [Saccharospirillum sp.]
MNHPERPGSLLTGLLTAALLSGCAAAPATPTDGRDDLMGQPVSLLYEQWGEPDYQSDTAGTERTLHIWNIDDCMHNVSTRADGTIIGYAATGDCPFMMNQ